MPQYRLILHRGEYPQATAANVEEEVNATLEEGIKANVTWRPLGPATIAIDTDFIVISQVLFTEDSPP